LPYWTNGQSDLFPHFIPWSWVLVLELQRKQ